MKRRDFLTTACVTGLAAASLQNTQMQNVQAAEPSGQPNYLDFRMIATPNAQRLEAMTKHFGEVVIPTTNKYGLSPVGLFVADKELNAKEAAYDKKHDSFLFSLIPHPTLDSTQKLEEKLLKDTAYTEATTALLQGASSQNPVFTSHERKLLRCFPEFPGINVPSLDPGRILQLRMYRSFSFERSRAKAHQIATQEGAIEVFEACGIKSVFYSTTLYGSFMPSLVFMLYFESEEQKNDSWAKFIRHPNWKKLADNPFYADTVTEVISIFLKPCQGSQI